MKIDLHTHSAHSDGTQSVDELFNEARDSGIDVLSLTDHDTFAGWEEAREAGERTGIRFIPGMELTARSADGASVHLLAYLPDPRNAQLIRVLDDARESRESRGRKIVDRLAEDYPVSWADVQKVVGEEDTSIGRPHIADALIARGIISSREEAFATLLSPRQKYFVPQLAPRPEEAVRLVLQAGGVPVFAHPRALSRGRIVGEEVFDAMVEAGLAGLEIDHRDNPEEARSWLRQYAKSHDLIVTGSSDFHGRGKPNLLGENTTAPGMLERILDAAGSEP